MLNGSDLNDEDDNRVNHKFTKAEMDRQERNISNMIKFMMTIQNPAHVSVNTECHLYNIITQEIVPDEISTDLLNVFEKGDLLYADFRQKRYIDKNVPLSDTIHRRNLKTFDKFHTEKKKQKSGNSAKASKKRNCSNSQND